MDDKPLAGKRLLVLEDEFLIAMDVEQLCRDHGAEEVSIHRSLDEIALDTLAAGAFHAAVIDVMLSGTPTYKFARALAERNVPFIFATGYSDLAEIEKLFPGVVVVGKPYNGPDLVAAIVGAVSGACASSGV